MIALKSDDSIFFTDHLIIGSGIAGLMLALKLSRISNKVTLIAKESLVNSNTSRAQGGIASVLDDKEDSFSQHAADTLSAGGGLCREDVVKVIVEGGPKAIKELIELGVNFTKSTSQGGHKYHLTREGGHSQRRVIHAEDLTGKEVVRAMAEAVKKDPNIAVYENQQAIELLTSDKYSPSFSHNVCLGAYILNKDTGSIYQIRSQGTYLCTGGQGRVYQYTSNYDGATGDGVAMGWRAGCKVANLEFMQFHPTCLYQPEAKTFLISEALRGEGAVLKNMEGHEFMTDVHPLGSLAPRDVVAKAIDTEIKRTGVTNVYLDATKIAKDKLENHFPNIFKTCLKYGIDIRKDLIPVVPAAHYNCGGLVVNVAGKTTVGNLFAVGETACTGLHGANRLASNSLLEALVMADKAAAHVKKYGLKSFPFVDVPPWSFEDTVPSDELVVLSHTWDEIRRMMWNYVGIMRTTKRLQRALERIILIRSELNKYYWDYQVTSSFIEVRNLADIAYLTIRCALTRKESRGIHYTLDYPEQDHSKAKDTILW